MLEIICQWESVAGDLQHVLTDLDLPLCYGVSVFVGFVVFLPPIYASPADPRYRRNARAKDISLYTDLKVKRS